MEKLYKAKLYCISFAFQKLKGGVVLNTKELYYTITRELNDILQNSQKKAVIENKKVYEAVDGAVLYDRAARVPIKLTEANEAFKVIYGDRVLVPYVRTSKFFTLDYIRNIRTLILVSYYASKKKENKKYDYLQLDADLASIIRKVLQKLSSYNSRNPFLKDYDFDINHSLAETYVIEQTFLFLLPFLRPDITFFLNINANKEVKYLLYNYKNNLEKIGKLLRGARAVVDEVGKSLTSNVDVLEVIKKYTYCGFYEDKPIVRLDLLTKTHLLLSTVLRIVSVLMQILKNEYEEFIYRCFYAALISVYNEVFPYIKYIHYKTIKDKYHPIKQVPDFGNLFFFRFVNIILSFLKKPELIIEILSGRDYYAFTVLNQDEEKRFNLMNSVFPFDTRVVEVLSEEEFLKRAEKYIRVYTLANEEVKVEIYEKLLSPYFKFRVLVHEKEYKPEPSEMLNSILLFEHYSLKSPTNQERWNSSFTYQEETDVSNFKKYSEKVQTILEQAKFSLFNDIDRFRIVRDKFVVCDYTLEKVREAEKVEEEKSEETVVEKSEEVQTNGTNDKKTTLMDKGRTILNKTDRIYFTLKTKRRLEEMENMEEYKFDEEAIDEDVYQDITSTLENRMNKKEETLEELLDKVDKKLDLILELLKKQELC